MDSLRGVCAGAGLDCRRLSRGSPRAGPPHEMQVRLERPELDRDLRALVSGIREALSQAVVSTAELTYRDPRGGFLTTSPPPEREAEGAGDPTAEEIEALKTNWIVRR